MTTVTLTRTLSGLSPADDQSRKALAKVPMGTAISVAWKNPRAGALHRRYWVLMQMICDNSEYPSAEAVSDHMKIIVGWCEPLVSKSTGEVWLRPKSISFANMDQGAFEDFWGLVVKATCEDFIPGITEPEIELELLRLVGAATWSA